MLVVECVILHCRCATNSTVHCPGQTDVEYMTEFSLWVMNQSPLMVRASNTATLKTSLNKPIFLLLVIGNPPMTYPNVASTTSDVSTNYCSRSIFISCNLTFSSGILHFGVFMHATIIPGCGSLHATIIPGCGSLHVKIFLVVAPCISLAGRHGHPQHDSDYEESLAVS